MSLYLNDDLSALDYVQLDYLRELQLERLKKIVRHAYTNVTLFRSRMDERGLTPDCIRTLGDLGKLPFTVKADLRDTYPFGLFAVPMSQVVRLHASSGTTGKPIVVGYTRQDLDIWMQVMKRALASCGLTHEDVIQVSYGYGLFTGGLGAHYGAEALGATVVPTSGGNTQRQITILRDFGSTVLCCTPSYAMYIAEVMSEEGVTPDDISLKAGIFGAEPWTEEMRRQLEEKLGIKAYDIYGLTEIMGPGVAYECSAQHGMHVNEDHFIIEIIDPDTGAPVPDGEQGEIVFTCLTKEAFPVIRYRTRDIGIVTRDECPCGRTFARMSKPMGRTDDMLIIRGVNVFPSQIETVLLRLGYSPNYQIEVDRVNNLDTFCVKVEMNQDHFSDTVTEISAMERTLAGEIRTILGVAPDVKLVMPRSIERSQGKAVRVIDRRKLH